MKVLAFDTTTSDFVVCLVDTQKNTKIDGAVFPCMNGHGKLILDYLSSFLKNNRLKISQIDAFAVVVGVGSFTGIRIGVCTARAFCQVLNKKLMPVDSLKYRAYNVSCENKFAVALNASSNAIYYAKFDNDKKTLCSTKFCPQSQAQTYLVDCDKVLCDTKIPNIEVQPYKDLDSSLANYVLGNMDKLQDYKNVVPFYLKKSQAEEQLAQKLVRNWTENDIKTLVNIEKQNFEEYWTEQYFLDSMQNKNFNVLVCEGKENIVSYLSYIKTSFEIDIANIATIESERRHGNAKILLDSLIDSARKEDIEKINLEVRVSNIPAQNLYKSFGFEIVGTRKDFYVTEDAYTMSLFLKE